MPIPTREIYLSGWCLPVTQDQQGEPEWQLTFVDFGMVGHISAQAREGMRDMLIGIVTRDVERVLVSYQKAGFSAAWGRPGAVKEGRKGIVRPFLGEEHDRAAANRHG